MQCIPSTAHREIYTVLNGPPSVLLLNRRGRCYGLQTPAHNRQIVGIVLLAKSLFVVVVDSIVAAATCCQNFSSGRGCVHTRHQYGGEKNPRLGCATKKNVQTTNHFIPNAMGFIVLYAKLTSIDKHWTRIRAYRKCKRAFFLLQFIYSSLHGEMNRDRCRWHRWQPTTKEETM